MKKRIASLAILVVSLLLAMSMLSLNIKPVEANLGLVTITVQYVDGYPRSGADVYVIWPFEDWLGLTDEDGKVTKIDYFNQSSEYYLRAFYGGSRFGPEEVYLYVNATGDGSATIQEDYEITPPVIEILSPQNTTYTAVSIPLIFTAVDYNNYSPIDWTGYSLDGQANETSGNTTLTVSQGTHNVIVYANDTYGNMGSSEVYFTVQSQPVGGIYIPPNKLELLAPYIGLTSMLIIAIFAATIYKRKKGRG